MLQAPAVYKAHATTVWYTLRTLSAGGVLRERSHSLAPRMEVRNFRSQKVFPRFSMLTTRSKVQKAPNSKAKGAREYHNEFRLGAPCRLDTCCQHTCMSTPLLNELSLAHPCSGDFTKTRRSKISDRFALSPKKTTALVSSFLGRSFRNNRHIRCSEPGVARGVLASFVSARHAAWTDVGGQIRAMRPCFGTM